MRKSLFADEVLDAHYENIIGQMKKILKKSYELCTKTLIGPLFMIHTIWIYGLTIKYDHGKAIMLLMINKVFIKTGLIHMSKVISESKLKPHILQYLREVQKTKEALIITDHGKPVLKIVPYSEDPKALLKVLRNTVIKYERPTDPVA